MVEQTKHGRTLCSDAPNAKEFGTCGPEGQLWPCGQVNTLWTSTGAASVSSSDDAAKNHVHQLTLLLQHSSKLLLCATGSMTCHHDAAVLSEHNAAVKITDKKINGTPFCPVHRQDTSALDEIAPPCREWTCCWPSCINIRANIFPHTHITPRTNA